MNTYNFYRVLDLQGIMDAYDVALEQRDQAIALGISKAIAHQLSVPPTPVNAPRSWYFDHHHVHIAKTLSAINEHYLIDLASIKDYTYKLWKARYDALNDILTLSHEDINVLIDAPDLNNHSDAAKKATRTICLNLKQYFDN